MIPAISRRRKPALASAEVDLLTHVLAYADRGWSLIPVAGKKAIGRWMQFQAVAPDETTLRKLFASKSVSGAAVILGQVSGMLGCRDFDSVKSYQTWADRHPKLAKALPTVRTGRGYHVYFKAPREAFENLGDGEYRADSGHYCVLPPSKHLEVGRLYKWLREPGKPLVRDRSIRGRIDPSHAGQRTEQGRQSRDKAEPSKPINPLHGMHVFH